MEPERAHVWPWFAPAVVAVVGAAVFRGWGGAGLLYLLAVPVWIASVRLAWPPVTDRPRQRRAARLLVLASLCHPAFWLALAVGLVEGFSDEALQPFGLVQLAALAGIAFARLPPRRAFGALLLPFLGDVAIIALAAVLWSGGDL